MRQGLLGGAARLSNWISKPTAIVGLLALLSVAVLTIINVLARWLLDQPLVGVHDLYGLVIVVVVAACFPTGVMQRKHVAIRFLGPALGRNATRWLDTFGALMTMVLLGIIAWQVTDEALTKIETGEYTLVLKIATAPVWFAAAIILWISVPMQAVVTINTAADKDSKSEESSNAE